MKKFINNSAFYFLLLLFGVNINSCTPIEESKPNGGIFEADVPENFNYETFETIHLDLTFSYSDFPMSLERFELYTDEYGQDLLFTGVTDLNGKFEQDIILPIDLENIYLMLSENEDGNSTEIIALKKLKNLKYHYRESVGNLEILSIELDEESGKCKWRIRNPLKTTIEINYFLNLQSETGTFSAPEGDSFFFTGYHDQIECEQCDEQTSQNFIVIDFTHNNEQKSLKKGCKCFCTANSKTLSWPSSTKTASIAFEDRWPYAGDYDLNDVVIDTKYQLEYKISDFNMIAKELKILYRVKFSGASQLNGYAIQLPIASEMVEKVDGTLKYSEVNLSYDESGVESGQSLATIMVFENARNLVTPYEHIPSEIHEITVKLKDGIHLFDLASKFPFNPFIYNSLDRTIEGLTFPSRVVEIHLPRKNPTDLVDHSLFDLVDEGGEPKYLTNPERYPWAILIPTSFEYPIERTSVNIAYPYLNNWVMSSGAEHRDWFLYPDETKVIKN